MSHVQYDSDDGNTYKIRMPTWVATLQTASAATTQSDLPKGVKPRVRYLMVTATGKEHRVVVVSAGNTLYNEASGTGHTIPTLGSGTATAVTSQGRTGEKMRNI
jgi:hypothetical protein